MQKKTYIHRRQFIGLAGMVAAGLILPDISSSESLQLRKAIPKTAEKLPVIGMGTSGTFDAKGNTEVLTRLQEVTQVFFDMGGGMIDSSPMYGSAEEVVGQLLPGVKGKTDLFAATKVWIEGKEKGREQMETSRQRWGIPGFDLIQIHNLVDWQTQLETLKEMKAAGRIRYYGITTSHGRDHDELMQILKDNEFDFVQLTYNIGNREVESPLLTIAQEKGIAVIVNRPYQRGSLFRAIKGKPLPPWAGEIDCQSWGQYFLKFVISHPAVTCTIPATSKVKHMQDNMQAGRGRMPTAKERIKMIEYFDSLT